MIGNSHLRVKLEMQINFRYWFVSVIAIGALLIGGCTTPQATSSQAPATSAANEATAVVTTQASNPQIANLPRLEGKATVVMTVKGKKSPITIEVDGTDAPITAGNFVDLVQQGVYDRLAFHRVIREPQPFVVQGGDPLGKDPNYPVGELGIGSFVDATGQPRYIPL